MGRGDGAAEAGTIKPRCHVVTIRVEGAGDISLAEERSGTDKEMAEANGTENTAGLSEALAQAKGVYSRGEGGAKGINS